MVQLAIGLKARGHRATIALFHRGRGLDGELVELGIPIVDLSKKGRWEIAGFLIRNAGEQRGIPPSRPLDAAGMVRWVFIDFVPAVRLVSYWLAAVDHSLPRLLVLHCGGPPGRFQN